MIMNGIMPPPKVRKKCCEYQLCIIDKKKTIKIRQNKKMDALHLGWNSPTSYDNLTNILKLDYLPVLQNKLPL
jgi:hypothetical protein